jgi:hypothetical protein
MTRQQAYAQIPENAKWSCSFGYPGEGGFHEIYRTADGRKFDITNGTFGDEWACTQEPRTAAGSLD